jgi:glyoxylate/hydroxypyruvate reductase
MSPRPMSTEPRTIGVVLPQDEQAVFPQALEAAVARSGRPLRVAPDADPAEVDYLVWNVDSGVTDFAPYRRLRAILNTWAGVEGVLGRVRWPAHVPLIRMVESGMNEGMAEYFTTHVMRYHLDVDRAQAQSAAGVWAKWEPPLARERTVGILGLGALGNATAAMLRPIGFRLLGWSRTAKELPGVDCRHGADGLDEVLGQAEILVLILPLTPETRNLLDASRLALLPPGACLINAGRGALIEDDALLGALASGRLRHATLDVFREEPLPPGHPFWGHPGITVTPHIAALTRPGTAAEAIIAQIGRDLDGLALQHVVDPARGY